MNGKVIINDLTIDALNLQVETKTSNGGSELKIVRFDFKVTSEDYHDVTTLLYKNDFIVKIPLKNLEFPAVIYNYSTSITNLYEEGTVGDFRLELIEKS
ncbi:DUF3219 family protein [Oceanobacillus saliphilus]|uniref:DUF3219 family protein n=1 Tax=Oceanobacillus saliphilus TaxID=2925834 RepID=UPI00201D64B2|nr:DUF3219 family protein [Oceanobacillus saliphilus]